MKNKNGFTLIELLSVMTFIVIIMAVAFPKFSSLTDSGLNNYDNSINKIVKYATKLYIENNKVEFDNITEPVIIPLEKLAAYDYINPNLKDSNGKDLDMFRYVTVTKDNNSYSISNLSNNTVENNFDYYPPIVILRAKPGVTYNCSTYMDVEKIEEFENNCEVISKDKTSRDGSYSEEKTIPNTNYSEIGSIRTYTYISIDAAGNKSKELIVKINKKVNE